jgi:hypothetical protein
MINNILQKFDLRNYFPLFHLLIGKRSEKREKTIETLIGQRIGGILNKWKEGKILLDLPRIDIDI